MKHRFLLSAGLVLGLVSCQMSGTPTDKTLPTVTLAANKTTLNIGENLELTATATDNKGVARVEFYKGAVKVGEDTTSPYTYTEKTTVDGNFTYTARAIDTSNNSKTSDPPTAITVNPTPPSSSGSGSGAMAVLEKDGETFAFVPSATGIIKIPLAKDGVIKTGVAASVVRPQGISKTDTFSVDACTADWEHFKVACVSYLSPNVYVMDVATGVVDTIATGLTEQVSYSGGNCYICGILYDPRDDVFLISTKPGYGMLDHLVTKTIKTNILADVAENFGYNPITNQIFSPQYLTQSSIDLVDVATKKAYKLDGTLVPDLDEPDHGAVDYNTNIGITANEYDLFAHLVDLNDVQLNQPAAGQFKTKTFTKSLAHNQQCNWPLTDISVDSIIHVAFFSAEFCSGSARDAMGFVKMPTSKTAPLEFGDYAFSSIPNPAEGVTWLNPGDPHGIANFTLAAGSKHYGLLMNDSKTYLAVVDLEKLMDAPRDPNDIHLVKADYDLKANQVIFFFHVAMP
ncbi:Ig-like domain-containing protein [Deinococcus roseus]|uniref:Bacterial Ig-like domain-containing protein n=1 Tax=Deinococcus roseus TaxID=392414 RepID=A0ABQ2D1B8_9DEIO|nr:Ig-like domain-containing protein [Deinococcus roseus]GGJ37034.1 hypothetical protein GCM10008938_23810 [Deinococcus roseus]